MVEEVKEASYSEAEEEVEENGGKVELSVKTPLNVIIDPFVHSKKYYLCLVALGVKVAEAERIIDRKHGKVYAWRNRSPYFWQVENFILEHKEEYRQQASQMFLNMISTNVLIGIKMLTEKAMEWDKLDKTDKQYVWEAMKMVSGAIGMRHVAAREDKESYEDTIKRLRDGGS